MTAPKMRVARSFRDPSGHIEVVGGVLRRQVNRSYAAHYDRLMSSGLYAELVESGLLIPHEEERAESADANVHLFLRPRRLAFLSYSYEWCFSQLQDAALAYLRIQKAALKRGMTLKDAWTSNMQFDGGRPILIDTLSFEILTEGEPWRAYRQFCECFLAPLALASSVDRGLLRFQMAHPDGVPLGVAAALLPARTWLNPGLAVHLHLHARANQNEGAAPDLDAAPKRFSLNAFRGLIDSLESTVSNLKSPTRKRGWVRYEQDCPYADEGRQEKLRLIDRFLQSVGPATLWDLGANLGEYSLRAPARTFVASLEKDHDCVEELYRNLRERRTTNILPLVFDLASPSPALGWQNQDTLTLQDRGPADAALALALIHHLALTAGVPFPNQASFLSGLCRNLAVEFVPESDPMVKHLLKGRKLPDTYSREQFEAAFGERFTLVERVPIRGSERTLYFYRRAQA